VEHDPNPLAPTNFLSDGRRPPPSCDRRLLEACRQLRGGIPEPMQGLAQDASAIQARALPEQEVSWEGLRAWLMEPQKAWLRELGMVATEGRDDIKDLEPLELDERDRAALLREAIAQEPQRPGAPGTGDAWLHNHRGEGRFPAGQGAVLEASRLQERWLSLQSTLAPLGEARTLSLQWGAWSGLVSLRGDAVVVVHPAQDRAAPRLDLWLQLQLAAAAMGNAPPWRGLLIARGSDQKKDSFAIQVAFEAPDPEGARRELARLAQLRQAWMGACWPVPPETGWRWVELGCPAPGGKGFEKVVDTWEGNSFNGFTSGGERQQEAMQVCFGSQRTLVSLLEDLPFSAPAMALFGPICQAVIPAKASRR
jgi:exodeoxyribonuclease V gamma subunit